MNADDLKPDQLQGIHDHLWPAANYLVRLKRKMEQRLFPRNDQLYLKTVDAYDHLLTLLHESAGRAARIGPAPAEPIRLRRTSKRSCG